MVNFLSYLNYLGIKNKNLRLQIITEIRKRVILIVNSPHHQ